MKSDALKSLFRTEMADVAEPFFWTDTEVYTYIDDAQKMFCRLTDGISDASTTAVTQIAVSAGDTWLDLHPRVLKIRSANRDSDGRPIELVNFEDLGKRGILLVAGRTAPLRLLISGMEENKLRLDCAAAADDTVRLLVFRLPITDITADAQDFEVPEQHHMHLLSWAKRCALLKQDAEVFDKSKAEEFEAVFRNYCVQAKREQEMKRHKGARLVAYGGLGIGSDHIAHGYGRRY